MYIKTDILIIKRLCLKKMKIKIERSCSNPKNKNLTWLGNLTKRLRLRKNKVLFSINNNDISLIALDKINLHSKSTKNKELVQQQYNGLLYANVAKLR